MLRLFLQILISDSDLNKTYTCTFGRIDKTYERSWTRTWPYDWRIQDVRHVSDVLVDISLCVSFMHHAKGQTNHAQADQKLYFTMQCSESFPFVEMNIFAWWAKIVAVGSYRRIILLPRKDYGQAFGKETCIIRPSLQINYDAISFISSGHMKR